MGMGSMKYHGRGSNSGSHQQANMPPRWMWLWMWMDGTATWPSGSLCHSAHWKIYIPIAISSHDNVFGPGSLALLQTIWQQMRAHNQMNAQINKTTTAARENATATAKATTADNCNVQNRLQATPSQLNSSR